MRELWETNLVCEHWVRLSNAGVRELRETLLLQLHCQNRSYKEARLRKVRSDDEEIGESAVLLVPGTV